MEGSFMAASFQAPAVDPAAAYYSSGYPSWVLLDKRAYFADCDNATTARARTSTGHDMKVTFCLADPPAVSHFCVHCPQLPRECYATEPRVVSSAEDLALLSFAFRTGPRSTVQDPNLLEYFVYKAAASSAGNPFIRTVPYSPPGTRHSSHATVVPRDGGNFLVADLSPRGGSPGHYDLHVFSSETNEWRTTHLQVPTPANVLPRHLPCHHDKTISLEGGMIGLVDLWRGIVVCDVLEKEPALRFIPLPTTAFNLHRTGHARPVRDVTGDNGFICFVEIEHCFSEISIIHTKSFKMTQHLDEKVVIFDKTCFTHGDLDDKLPELVPDGWKIRTMYKAVSWDYWKRRHPTVHVDDISAVTKHFELLPRLWNCGAMKCTLRNLETTGFPFFGAYGDNFIYLMAKVESDDEDSWIVGVDLEKKKLEVIEPYCAASAGSFDPALLPCAFSEYMNATPRPYDELLAASFSQSCVLNSDLPLDDTVPATNNAQNGMLNDHLPSGKTIPATDCTQNGVPNDHLSSGSIVPDNVQPQQNTWNNEDGYYEQTTPFEPQFMAPPNLPQHVQPKMSSTPTWVSGYIHARWMDPDGNGQMLMTVPLDDMRKLTPVTPPFAPPMPLMAAPPPFAQPSAQRPAPPRQSAEKGAANSAQTGVRNGYLSSGYIVPDNMQPQQNMWDNGDGYYRSSNGYGYGAYPGYATYQQPIPFQPQSIRSPNLP